MEALNARPVAPCMDLGPVAAQQLRKAHFSDAAVALQSRLVYWLNAVVLPLIVVFGLGGYLLLLWTLRRRTQNRRMWWHIVATCVWDCTLMILAVVVHSMTFWLNERRRNHGSMVYLIYFVYPLAIHKTHRSLTQVFNVKYLCCNLLAVLISVSETFFARRIQDSDAYWSWFFTSTYFVEASNTLLVVHSATNWPLFIAWRRRDHISSKGIDALRGEKLLTRADARILAHCWRLATPQTFGRDLLVCICVHNAELGRRLYGSSDANVLIRNQHLHINGRRITQFLDNLIQRLLVDRRVNMRDVRTQLRLIGTIHYHQGVILNVDDWKLWKSFLAERLIQGSRSVGTSGHSASIFTHSGLDPSASSSIASSIHTIASGDGEWPRPEFSQISKGKQKKSAPAAPSAAIRHKFSSHGPFVTRPKLSADCDPYTVIANRFSSFIVFEIKSGFICSSVAASEHPAPRRVPSARMASLAVPPNGMPRRWYVKWLNGRRMSSRAFRRVRNCPLDVQLSRHALIASTTVTRHAFAESRVLAVVSHTQSAGAQLDHCV